MNMMSKKVTATFLLIMACAMTLGVRAIFAQRSPQDVAQDGADAAADRINSSTIDSVKELPLMLYEFGSLFDDISGSTDTPPFTPVPDGAGPQIPIGDLTSGDGVTYSEFTVNSVAKCLGNVEVYRKAEQITGVPWKILAGIHYVEGNCGSDRSLVSGREIGVIEPDIGRNCSTAHIGPGYPTPVWNPSNGAFLGCKFTNLLDTAIYGGNHLKGKIGGKVPQSIEELAKALGRYNGLGNANCGRVNAVMPYCPPKYENYDHIYPFSKLDKVHERMYLVYCADYTKCNPPKEFTRIGVLTVARILIELGY